MVRANHEGIDDNFKFDYGDTVICRASEINKVYAPNKTRAHFIALKKNSFQSKTWYYKIGSVLLIEKKYDLESEEVYGKVFLEITPTDYE